MNHYRIPSSSYSLNFDPLIQPVATVESGDIVTFETNDGRYAEVGQSGVLTSEMHGTFNRVTGPVAIVSSEPGDVLRIDVQAITITRLWAVWFPDDRGFVNQSIRIKQLHVTGDRIELNDRLTVPLKPMIGCIGLAPKEGISSAYVPAFPWGGNMDLPEVQPGATLFLPVQTPGALLSVGDLHAAMGRGEPLDVGLEAGGETTLKLTLIKNMPLRFPRIHLGTSIFCTGIGESYREAKEQAIAQAYEVLTKEFGLEPFDAFAYASATLTLHFGGPAADMVLAEIPAPW